MFFQENALEEYRMELKKAIGPYSDVFAQKMEWLKNKWTKLTTDSEETRLMHPIVLFETTPINISIIADNIEYFQKQYKETPYVQDPGRALDRACLCGSQQIAEFLLKEFNLTYLSENCDDLLSYVAGSINLNWAKEIAKLMAEANKTIPLSLYGLANDDVIDVIVDIFGKKKPVEKIKL